jgi:WD40 repeat protein
MEVVRVIEEHDALFDCAWTESDTNLILSGCGDGEVCLWDVSTGAILFKKHEHKGEVQSIDCSSLNT